MATASWSTKSNITVSVTLSPTEKVELELPYELVKAMADFRTNKDSGRIEMHYSQGGVAKIFANVSRTYK